MPDRFDEMARELLGIIWDAESYDTKLRATIAALCSAATVPEGFVRQGTTDMPLLGTLPVTADGCVVGEDALLWYPASDRKNSAIDSVTSAAMTGEDGGYDGCFHWYIFGKDARGPVYSTRVAAEAARGEAKP